MIRFGDDATVNCGMPGCQLQIGRGRFMCGPHWYAVPQQLRNAVLGARDRVLMHRRLGARRAVVNELDADFREAWRAVVANLQERPICTTCEIRQDSPAFRDCAHSHCPYDQRPAPERGRTARECPAW